MSDEKKEGFSYSSTNIQQKRVILLLLVELLVGILVVTFIFGMLNYFNIFPISKIFPDQLGWLPSQKNIRVEAASDIPGYRVEITNPKEIIDLAKSWGVLDKRYGAVPQYGSGTSEGQIYTVRFHLTDKEQQYHKTSSNDVTTLSSSAVLSEGVIDVYVYIEKKTLEGLYGEDVPDKFFQAGGLQAIYRLVNESKTKEEFYEVNEKMKSVIAPLFKDGKIYFNVKKK